MSDSSKASSMAELMAKHKSNLVTLSKGQVVKGKVTKVSSSEILLDVNAKTEAVVMEKDRQLLKQLLHSLHVGDSVDATVIYPESENGSPVVSLRAFVGGKMWEELERLQKSGEKMDVMVTDSTKGGFLVETSTGLSGFLPNSHVTATDVSGLVGKTIKARIVEVQKDAKKVIFSQKDVLSDVGFAKAQQLYTSGTKVKGTISGITTFGLFVSLPFSKEENEPATIDGMVHISEVSWERVEDLGSRFKMGQEVDAVVIGVDKDSKRIDLSIKRLSADPFAKIVEEFPVDKKVTGYVTEVTDAGVVLSLGQVEDTDVEGMIKKEKISPNTTYEVGQKVNATVVSVDAKRRKVYLTPVLLEKPLMYR